MWLSLPICSTPNPHRAGCARPVKPHQPSLFTPPPQPLSIPAVPLAEQLLDAANEPLIFDAAFRQTLMDGLVEVGGAVQDAFGGAPQDVEGVWAGGRFAVVQARPQVV